MAFHGGGLSSAGGEPENHAVGAPDPAGAPQVGCAGQDWPSHAAAPTSAGWATSSWAAAAWAAAALAAT